MNLTSIGKLSILFIIIKECFRNSKKAKRFLYNMCPLVPSQTGANLIKKINANVKSTPTLTLQQKSGFILDDLSF